VKAYAVSMPRFFTYLLEAREPITGPEDLGGRHVDGFEAWLEAAGYSRIHLFTLLVKLIAVLRQIAADEPSLISPDLRDRLRYASAKPFQRSRPRDAYSPFVARQLRDAARADVTTIARRLRGRSCGGGRSHSAKGKRRSARYYHGAGCTDPVRSGLDVALCGAMAPRHDEPASQ
jgi:hypothetical protein